MFGGRTSSERSKRGPRELIETFKTARLLTIISVEPTNLCMECNRSPNIFSPIGALEGRRDFDGAV